jgi:transketolase
MWEAALFAGSEKLNNLTMIVDDNHSLKEMLDIGSFTQKLETFGFEVENVDGHSEEALFQAFTKVRTEKPRAIVANTIRGYGSKTIMMDNTWFHRAPNKEELKKLKEEVDAFE